MNNVYLCVGNYAKKPFYVNFSDISLYSIEELCYYFIDRIYLLDYDMMNQQLVDWIRTECGMTKLADELDVYVRKHVSVAAFVTTILESTGLYDENTIRKVDRVLKEQADLVLPSTAVSRVHASIEQRAGNWYLKDMNSRNGTSVNGRLLRPDEEYQLEPEDEVDFAQARYIFLE